MGTINVNKDNRMNHNVCNRKYDLLKPGKYSEVMVGQETGYMHASLVLPKCFANFIACSSQKWCLVVN